MRRKQGFSRPHRALFGLAAESSTTGRAAAAILYVGQASSLRSAAAGTSSAVRHFDARLSGISRLVVARHPFANVPSCAVFANHPVNSTRTGALSRSMSPRRRLVPLCAHELLLCGRISAAVFSLLFPPGRCSQTRMAARPSSSSVTSPSCPASARGFLRVLEHWPLDISKHRPASMTPINQNKMRFCPVPCRSLAWPCGASQSRPRRSCAASSFFSVRI